MITDDTECWDTEELRVSSKAERSLVIMQIRSIPFFLGDSFRDSDWKRRLLVGSRAAYYKRGIRSYGRYFVSTSICEHRGGKEALFMKKSIQSGSFTTR